MFVRKFLVHCSIQSYKMPKRNVKKSSQPQVKECKEQKSMQSVIADKNGNVVIKILAKPGAKCNRVTEVSDEGIAVQINAPPVDGEANTELIKYMSTILGIRKSDITLDRGSRSRHKILLVSTQVCSLHKVIEKLSDSISK